MVAMVSFVRDGGDEVWIEFWGAPGDFGGEVRADFDAGRALGLGFADEHAISNRHR